MASKTSNQKRNWIQFVFISLIFLVSWVMVYLGASLTQVFFNILAFAIILQIIGSLTLVKRKKYLPSGILILLSLFVIYQSLLAFKIEKYCWNLGQQASVQMVPASSDEQREGLSRVTMQHRTLMKCERNSSQSLF